MFLAIAGCKPPSLKQLQSLTTQQHKGHGDRSYVYDVRETLEKLNSAIIPPHIYKLYILFFQQHIDDCSCFIILFFPC